MENIWKSSKLNQQFVLTGQTATWDGTDKKDLYEGEIAHRTDDGELALVKLTRKPEKYRFDFVLWN